MELEQQFLFLILDIHYIVLLDRAFPGKELEVSCIYPKACGDVFHYDDYSKTLQIHFPETYMARLFQIKVK